MKRSTLIFFVLVTTLRLAGMPEARAAGSDSIGMIASLTGTGSIIGADKSTRDMAVKAPVYLNDRLITAAGSKAQVMLEDDTMLQQGPGSELVLDKYVYSPNIAKDKTECNLKLVRGTFRVLSGKITKLNPERFKVKTRMATVGIRGCETDFSLRSPKREDVLVRWLPPGHSIHIKKDARDADGPDELLITEAGFGVTIMPGIGLFQRPVTKAELRAMKNAVLRVPAGNAPNNGNGNLGNQAVASTQSAVQGKTAEELKADRTDKLQAQADAALNQTFTSLDILPGPTEGPSADPITQALPALGNGAAPWSSWFCQLSTDGTVAYGPEPTAPNGGMLQSADLAVLAGAGPAQILTTPTPGPMPTPVNWAGAQIRQNGAGITIGGGSCHLQVNVGNAASPTWQGSVFMEDYGAQPSLFTFGMSGTIDPANGKMSGAIDTGWAPYTLQFQGGPTLTDADVTSQSIKGQLTGDGITGAAGEYHFGHTDGTTVDGGFGSGLN